MSLTKLRKENNNYYITNRRQFDSNFHFSDKIISKVFEFSYGMTFGKSGEHRSYRSGGQRSRKNGELFINTFQGKLAEFGVYHSIADSGISDLSEPDMDTWELGEWDQTDIECSGLKLNIKSTKSFGNLLLLETKDWNNDGLYIPNIGKDGNGKYDLFLLTRVSPDGEKLIKFNRLYYSNELSGGEQELGNIIYNEDWKFDIAGIVRHDLLKHAISEKLILPQNAMLNAKVKMDAENYYIQAGDMMLANDLKKLLKIMGVFN